MKSIKNAMKLSMIIAALFFSSEQIKAQQIQDPQMVQKKKEMAEQRFKEFSEKLSLNAEQQARIKMIVKENRMEMRQIRETKKEAPKEEKRAAMAEQLKKGNEKINSVLDSRQQELYKQYIAEKKVERQKKMQEKKKENEQNEEGLF